MWVGPSGFSVPLSPPSRIQQGGGGAEPNPIVEKEDGDGKSDVTGPE